MNQIILTGYLTRDIELSRTSSGKAVTKVGLAVRKHYGDESDFFTIKIWDKLAEHAAKYLRKGSKVLVRGHLAREVYQKDDVQIERVLIECDEIEFLIRSKKDDQPAPATLEKAQEGVAEDYPYDDCPEEGEGDLI